MVCSLGVRISVLGLTVPALTACLFIALVYIYAYVDALQLMYFLCNKLNGISDSLCCSSRYNSSSF